MTEALIRQLSGFLGLCARARQLVTGQDACVGAIRSGSAALALLDESCSAGSRKRFTDSCHSHGVPLYGLPQGLLAQAMGRSGRMSAVIGHGSMADKLRSLLKEEPTLQPEPTDPVSQSERESH